MAAEAEGADPPLISFLRDAEGPGALAVVRQMVAAGDADAASASASADGSTALHLAAARGLADVVRFLVQDAGVPVDARNPVTGETALHVASSPAQAEEESEEEEEEEGNDDDEGGESATTPTTTSETDDDDNDEAETDSAPTHRALLDLGADVSARDAMGRTPLFGCASKGDAAAVALLIKLGASPDVVDAQGLTPLLVACGSLDFSTDCTAARRLLRASSEETRRAVEIKSGYSALDFAAQAIDAAARKVARHSYMFDPEPAHLRLLGALMACGLTAHPESAPDLLPVAMRLGVPLERVGLQRANVGIFIYYCGLTWPGLVPCVRALREAGAAFWGKEALDNDDLTPLVTAAKIGHEELVEYLLGDGRPQGGWPRAELDRALLEACTPYGGECDDEDLRNSGTCRRLLDAGADPNTHDNHFSTPLLNAIKRGDSDSVLVLLERGADPDRADAHGTTPLLMAALRRMVSYSEPLGDNAFGELARRSTPLSPEAIQRNSRDVCHTLYGMLRNLWTGDLEQPDESTSRQVVRHLAALAAHYPGYYPPDEHYAFVTEVLPQVARRGDHLEAELAARMRALLHWSLLEEMVGLAFDHRDWREAVEAERASRARVQELEEQLRALGEEAGDDDEEEEDESGSDEEEEDESGGDEEEEDESRSEEEEGESGGGEARARQLEEGLREVAVGTNAADKGDKGDEEKEEEEEAGAGGSEEEVGDEDD